MTTCEVAIIGLGPVGATLANLLGQSSTSTIALDLANVVSQQPRAVTFDDEVMRIFAYRTTLVVDEETAQQLDNRQRSES